MRRLLPLFVLLLAAAAPARLATVPLSRTDLPWWRQRFDQKQAELRERRPALIFLGDSITQDWERPEFQPAWQQFYGRRNAVNLGFSGDNTGHLLWRERNGELDGISPRVAVMLIGANNFGLVHWDAATTVAGIAADVAEVRRRLPQTKLLLLSILPSERSAWVTENTAEANRTLATRFRDDPAVTFVDVTEVFAPQGRFDRTLFLDPQLTPPQAPLHPSAEGQARMAAAIEPTLARLLGERP